MKYGGVSVSDLEWYLFFWLGFMDSDYSMFHKDKIGRKAVTDSDSQPIQSYGAQILVHYSSD